jgi:cytochrome P450
MATFAESITVADLDRDPYPIYARLRKEAPVAYVPAVNLWLVTRAEDVEFVTTHPDLFTAQVTDSTLDRSFKGKSLLTMDGDEHLNMRKSLDSKYRPRMVSTYIDDLVTPIATEQLGEIISNDRRELVASYFEPISVLSLGAVLGLGHLSADTLQHWFHGLAMGATNFERDPEKQKISDAVESEMNDELLPLIETLVVSPDDSTISHMLHSGMPDGEKRSAEYILPTLKLTILGGMQEPGHGAAATFFALANIPGAFERLRRSPELWDDVIQEGLRWIAPIGTQTRQTTQDVELGGVVIPAGSAVAAVVASASRDETVFANPDTFDMDRPRQSNASFGYGPHFCAGHAFARGVERISLQVLVEGLPDISLSNSDEVEFTGWEFRAPTSLNVNW